MRDAVDDRFIEKLSAYLAGVSNSNFPINWNDERHKGIYLSEEYPFRSTNEICRFVFPAARNPQKDLYNGNKYSMYCWKWFNGIPFFKECLKLFGEEGDKYIIEIELQNNASSENQENEPFELLVKSRIYYGPPGTGKTREAKKMAGKIIAKDDIVYR